MSFPSTCHSCLLGSHDKHDRDFGIRPGLIGGEYCACEGDCAHRHDATTDDFATFLRSRRTPDTTEAEG